jgi:hypothetical protein
VKNLLRRIYEGDRKPAEYRLVENGSRTYVGMLLPVSYVERIAAKVLRFETQSPPAE